MENIPVAVISREAFGVSVEPGLLVVLGFLSMIDDLFDDLWGMATWCELTLGMEVLGGHHFECGVQAPGDGGCGGWVFAWGCVDEDVSGVDGGGDCGVCQV